MKLLSLGLSSTLVVFLMSHQIYAAVDETSAQQAFSERAYSPAGVERAKEAAQIYHQLAAQESDINKKNKLRTKESEALYFVNDAMAYAVILDEKIEDVSEAKKPANIEIKNSVIAGHSNGFEVAIEVLKHYGADLLVLEEKDPLPENLSKLSDEDKSILAQAFYFRGVNLAGWAKANGRTRSLKEWPKLRGSMLAVIALGKANFSSYGPYRVLGRVYHVLPGIVGGDKKKAKKYLSEAVQNSFVSSQSVSSSLLNSFYLGQVLIDLGEEDAGIATIEKVIGADVKQLDPTLSVENERVKADARTFLETIN